MLTLIWAHIIRLYLQKAVQRRRVRDPPQTWVL